MWKGWSREAGPVSGCRQIRRAGHPRLLSLREQDVDGRDGRGGATPAFRRLWPGHDENIQDGAKKRLLATRPRFSVGSYPRPTNGILLAITVMNSTLASSGRPAM